MKNEFVPLYRDMAAGNQQFFGLSILQHAKEIGRLIKEHSADSVLDFGSGRGDAYRSPFKIYKTWGLQWNRITLYDPAFPQHENLPDRTFDAVICSDVLEHVAEEDVDEFIDTLFEHAKLFVWASVCCRPARKTFPGTDTNLHVTVQPYQWWEEKMQSAIDRHHIPAYLVESP